ncbi:MAG: hypothetical protein LBW85_11990 [Deltaproteobacteria bacterium]|jgi:hypothetical protein|nr:hypothetical protein [Deltaproteobacteria bacterium]
MEEYVDEYDLRIIQKTRQETKADLALNLLKAGIQRQIIIESFGVTERWLQELEERLKGGPVSG